HVVDAREHDLARVLVPVRGDRQHVVLRKPPVHLGRRAASLSRQAAGWGGVAFGVAHQRSRLAAAAARPSPPTRTSEPGASSGGPLTVLLSGSRRAPGGLCPPVRGGGGAARPPAGGGGRTAAATGP